MNIQKTVFLEECSKNYVDLVKGYAETIQEQFPTNETIQLPKRERRGTFSDHPNLIKARNNGYDNPLFNLHLNYEFCKFW